VSVTTADRDRVVAVSAYNAAGSSRLSNQGALPVSTNPGGGSGGGGGGGGTTPPPMGAGTGGPYIFAFVSNGTGGTLHVFDGNGQALAAVAQDRPPAGGRDSLKDLRPASCEVDGDGVADLVVGFGYGSGGQIEVRHGEARGFSHRAWLQLDWDDYTYHHGATWPACGDVDGDGRDEIVVGLTGSGAGGWIQIFDDARAQFRPLAATPSADGWIQLTWEAYNLGAGVTYPALGNLDGDARDEIVVGLGQGGGGWLQVFDDARAGFAPVPSSQGDGWLQVEWSGYATINGTTYPAVGNVDGDARDEVVVGLGLGGAGWLQGFDDASNGFALLPTQHGSGWVQMNWDTYNAADGTIVPSIHDMTGDGVEEVIGGLSGLAGGSVPVFSSAAAADPSQNLLFIGLSPPVDLSGARLVLGR
jgi:hypothetical protein